MNTVKKKRSRHWICRMIWALLLILIVIIGDIFVVFITHGRTENIPIDDLENKTVTSQNDEITVITINMAHGRGKGVNQIFQSKKVFEKNLTSIGDIIKREKADIVALQEADAPSWWSGKYSHVKKVGEFGGMKFSVQGKNVDGLGLHYGTAIVTKVDIKKAKQITFNRNIPTFSKGFVIATCIWPNDPKFYFDVVSIHLDFASAKVRKKQLRQLGDELRKNNRPVIIMGDFNTDATKQLLPEFLNALELSTWKQNDTEIITFPGLNTRIDWIIVSHEFRILRQSVLDDVVSDHKALKAVICRVTNNMQK